ncbi:putative Ig domain-containing protein [Herbiconiux moechotypicola]|uniref:Uncharacterized protein n=1 Tax=Herbiconiux moechotypicola TaxID=637393 RepID=A0ABN3DCT3_9MICO|nr:putative Ig domain-containing protein [Herbiconiux moechotypicola]MCS5728757.1 putative Ig domain-containing protein [Herbiconiux moechotypicola]
MNTSRTHLHRVTRRAIALGIAAAVCAGATTLGAVATDARPAQAAVTRAISFTATATLHDAASRSLVSLEVDPGTGRAYAIERPSGDVVVYDTSGSGLRSVARVAVGGDAVDLAVNTATHQVYVSDHAGDSVVVIDGHPASPTANTVVDSIPTTGSGARGIAVDSGAGVAYVANEDSVDLSRIDLGTRAIARIAMPNVPFDVGVSSSDHRVYVTSQVAGTLIPVSSDVAGSPVSLGGGAIPTALDVGAGEVLVGTSAGSDYRVRRFDALLAPAATSTPLDAPATTLASDGSVQLAYVTTGSGALRTFLLDTLSDVGDSTTYPADLSAMTVDQGSHHLLGVTASLTGATITSYDVAASPLILSPRDLAGEVGAAYTSAVVASGRPETTAFSVTSGTLPPGISLDTAGVFSGIPTVAGVFTFTVTADNSSPTTDSVTFTFTVASKAPSAPVVSSTPPPGGTVGAAYGPFTFTASGVPQPSLIVKGGTLPPGLLFDEITYQLRGTPTTAGSYTFVITADNGVGSNSRPFTVVIAPAAGTAPTITSAAPPAGRAGEPYGPFSVTASGAPAPTISIVAGSLPTGLTLDPRTHQLSGTPTEWGTFRFRIEAKNALGTDSRFYALVIEEGTPTPATPTPTPTPSPSASATPDDGGDGDGHRGLGGAGGAGSGADPLGGGTVAGSQPSAARASGSLAQTGLSPVTGLTWGTLALAGGLFLATLVTVRRRRRS